MHCMKRGQGMSINTIVLAVLALVVLVILIFLVRTQLQKGSQKYLNISGEAENEAKSKNICETMFSLKSRTCMSASDCTTNIKGTPWPGPWQDCEKKAPGSICCEAP
jgi:hypothetical protein